MKYENWKELTPLTAPVPVGTKCVVVNVGPDDYFECGDIVEIADKLDPPLCKSDAIEHFMYWRELALLPSDTAEPAKQERKIVQIATDSNGVTVLCSDGSIWFLRDNSQEWAPFPPIPQDAA